MVVVCEWSVGPLSPGQLMTDDDSRLPNLSRRQALAGIGGIGAAAAIGGIGTTALYSDIESADLTVSAGDLDLLVDAAVFAHSVYDDGTVTAAEQIIDVQETNPPSDTLVLSISDMKPGDCLCVVFSVHLDGNPAWVWQNCAIHSDVENGTTEPEIDAENAIGIQDADSEGELDDAIQAYSAPVNTSLDNLSSCPSALDVSLAELGVSLSSLTPAIEFFDGDTGTQTIEPLGSQQTRWHGWKLCLPPESGNETQTDEISISCTFEAEQARNNPVPSVLGDQAEGDFNNPYVDESPSASSGSGGT